MTWPAVTLGEVLRPVDTSVPSAQLGEVNLAGVYSFGRGLFRRGPMSPAETSYRSFNRLVTDDFVISQPKAWEGAVARVSPEFDGWFLSPVFPTFRANTDHLVPSFLDWFCRRQSVWSQLLFLSKGIGARRETVTPESFLSLRIPLPPLPEQRRVVARIDEVAGLVAEAGRLRCESSEAAGALWEVCASEALVRGTKGVARVPLRKLIELRGGGTPSKSNPFFWQGPIPWVTPKDMKIREIHDAQDHISESAVKASPAKLIPPGAVLVVVRGMILAHTVPSAVLRVPAAINQDMKALVPGGEILPEYLSSLFWAENKNLLALVEKSTHDTRKLETPKLLAKEIPLPELDDQRRIVAALNDLEAEASELARFQSESSAALDALLPAVLDRAFRGEL